MDLPADRKKLSEMLCHVVVTLKQSFYCEFMDFTLALFTMHRPMVSCIFASNSQYLSLDEGKGLRLASCDCSALADILSSL